MIIVPDASILLKWVLQRDDEIDSGAALKLLESFGEGQVDIQLPSLWRYEVANVLARKIGRHAPDALQSLIAYQFGEHALELDYCLDVLRFMRSVPAVSFYDASYHVLAIRLRGTFVTADERYLRIAQRRGHIVSLAEWPTEASQGVTSSFPST